MINVFRKNQKWLMIFVTILVIISFVVLYNTTQFEMIGVDRVGSIYGKTVSAHEMQREQRKIELASGLGMMDYIQNVSAPGEGMDGAIWNSMVVDYEADKMQIVPTADAIADGIKKLPAFQTNGEFDFAKYSSFVENQLAPLGFTREQLEELVSDDLRVKEIKALIGSTVLVADSEVRRGFDQRFGKIDAQVVRFSLADFVAKAEVTDENVKKAFEERQGQYLSDEKRKVRYVKFALPEAKAKLEGPERIREVQKLADAAQQFSVEMTESDADFAKLAEKEGVTVQETDFFTIAEPPVDLAAARGVAVAAFELTMEQPNSDVIQAGADSFYVAQITGVEGREPLAFDASKDRVKGDLTQERGKEAMELKIAEVRSKIQEALDAGKTFTEAAIAAGVKAEQFPKFSPSEPNFETPDAREVMMSAFEMKKGALSGKVDTATGADLVYLANREPVSDEEFAKQKLTMREASQRMKTELYYHEWLRLSRIAANVKVAQR